MNQSNSGYFLINKDADLTSQQVVATVRRIINQKKVGHGGTLDPNARGLLVVGIGSATRLLKYVTQLPKTYTFEICLGETTTTDDDEGEIIYSSVPSNISEQDVKLAASRLTGEILQLPPKYSAKKINGRRAYQLARENEEFDLRPVSVKVEEFNIAKTNQENLYFARVKCSSGTYVRALARDIGIALGCGAHARNIFRSAIGDFNIESAIKLQEISLDKLNPPSGMVAQLPAVVLSNKELVSKVLCGAPLTKQELGYAGEGEFRVEFAGALLGIYRTISETKARPVMVLENNSQLSNLLSY